MFQRQFSITFVTLFCVDFEIPISRKRIEVGLIVGTVGGGLFFVFLIMVILWRKGYIMGGKVEDRELTGIDLQTGIFTLRQLKRATNDFDPSNKLGEGGFGSVFKGLLSDGTIIAVKQLSSQSKQGAREFVNEIGMITALRHPNLVRLYGCCVEGNQMSLIYEYMANNCLSRSLLGTDKMSKAKLTWPMRLNICKGIARGLVYLHDESHLRIIHRDIKASNILLDEDHNAKVSDFGLAKLSDDGNTHINTRIVGTMGYMAPEYAMGGHLTTKADVYSFGILTLEIVSGISCNKNISYKSETEQYLNLYDWVCLLHVKGTLLELVDPDLGSEYSPEEALTIIQVAFLCTKGHFCRPTMSQTLSVLEGQTNVQDLEKELLSSTTYPDKKHLMKQLWPDHSEIHPTHGEPLTESFVTESFVTESFIRESS
uniref:Protein kinase domain-containing protein n=1 Tax=Helianthus annuus TaxID=4232 RepID=A0A251V1N9_HELAN